MVLLVGLDGLVFGFSCVAVVWLSVFYGFPLPHSPSVPSTFFYPSLKLPYPPQSFGAGISESDEK